MHFTALRWMQKLISFPVLAATSNTTTNDSINQVIDSTQEVTQSTVDDVNQFVQYFNDNIPNLIAFGLKVLIALVFFGIGSKIIKWIRKLVGRSMERGNVDLGVRQFVD